MLIEFTFDFYIHFIKYVSFSLFIFLSIFFFGFEFFPILWKRIFGNAYYGCFIYF